MYGEQFDDNERRSLGETYLSRRILEGKPMFIHSLIF